MKTILVATKDVVTGEIRGLPSMYRNEAEAKRAWGDAIKYASERGNPDRLPLRDLNFFKIGEFDTESFKITPLETAEYLCCGGEFIVAPIVKEEVKTEEKQGE